MDGRENAQRDAENASAIECGEHLWKPAEARNRSSRKLLRDAVQAALAADCSHSHAERAARAERYWLQMVANCKVKLNSLSLTHTHTPLTHTREVSRQHI